MPRKKKSEIKKIELDDKKIKLLRELKPTIKVIEEKTTKKEIRELENEEEQEEAEQHFTQGGSRSFTRNIPFARAPVLESQPIQGENLENEIARTPTEISDEKTQKTSYIHNLPAYSTPNYDSRLSEDETSTRRDMEMDIARTRFNERPAGFTLQETGVRQINVGNLQRQEMERMGGFSQDAEKEYEITAKRHNNDKEKLPFE